MSRIRDTVANNAITAIAKAQQRQKVGDDKKHGGHMMYKPGDTVLLRNLQRADRKGRKVVCPG